jgi:hypothetical protein
MSPRSIRRAAERKSLKDARKTVLPTAPIDAVEQIPSARPVSEARLAANAANAQLSTGPSTPAGKAKSSVNAVTTALTGRTVLLPSDDVAAYQQHLQNFADEFHPVGPRETELVQAIADHAWRLIRISNLEMAFFASGHEQFAEQFADRGAMQASFTQMHTFLHYEKQIRNLQIQEARLRRNREKDTAELRRLQQERLKKEEAAADDEPEIARGACENGFDFAFTGEYAEVDATQHFETSPLSHSELPELSSRPRIAA